MAPFWRFVSVWARSFAACLEQLEGQPDKGLADPLARDVVRRSPADGGARVPERPLERAALVPVSAADIERAAGRLVRDLGGVDFELHERNQDFTLRPSGR